MSEFLHVHLLDKKPMESELGKSIPLHITMLHWFESSRHPDEIVVATQQALDSIRPMVMIASEEDLFGPNIDIPVMKLSKTSESLKLHIALLKAMEGIGATFDSRWTGVSNWNPHVTHKQNSRLRSGEEVLIDNIDLITRLHEDGNRKVLHRFNIDS